MLVRVAVICNRIGQVQRLSYLRDIQMKIETGTGYRLGQRQELAEGRVINRGPFLSERANWEVFGRIRLESRGSDCTMGSGVKGKWC